ncbi:MAG: hexose kinase [Anaerolineae bacterium]|nr:hexose kinase [Anaerolineae bacterium]
MGRIVTLTANTTIDQTLVIPRYASGTTIRAKRSVVSIGGKPTDVSYILGEMGVGSLALGFAADTAGLRAKQILESRSVEVDFIEVDGETRMNVLIADEGSGTQTTITTDTLIVSEAHVTALDARLDRALNDAACVMLGGTLPSTLSPSLYTRWIGLIRARGVPVLFDADQPNLAAGLEARPDFIKPNRDELSRLIGRPISGLADVYSAARDLVTRFGTTVVATLGAGGALAVHRDGAWFVPPLDVPVVSAGGAGDGVMAGLTESIWRGEPLEMGLRRGFAYAAAVVQQAGTAQLERREAERLLPLVQIEPYPAV